MADKKYKIMLDAGHFAKNNRSPIYPLYYESEAMWKLQKMVKEELIKFGFEVLTTRDDSNKDLDVVLRGKAAKDCDLLISLHSNACDDPQVDRVCIIHQTDNSKNTYDEKSKEIAAMLSAEVALAMGTKDAPKYYQRLAQSDRDKDGIINDNYYGLLHGAALVKTPAIIIEHSFHTNLAATKLLMVDSNLQKIAVVEAENVAKYFGVKKPVTTPTENITPTPTATTNQNDSTTIFNVLKKGSKGADVKALQILLVGYGYSVGSSGADGAFGTNTDEAVRKYQKANNLTVDGCVGSITWKKLLGIG